MLQSDNIAMAATRGVGVKSPKLPNSGLSPAKHGESAANQVKLESCVNFMDITYLLRPQVQ